MPAAKQVILSSATARSKLRAVKVGDGEGGGKGKSLDSPNNHPPTSSPAATKNNDQKTSLVDLASLSAEQKKALLAQLSLELADSAKGGKDQSRDLEMWASAVYDSLSKVVPAHGYGQLLVRKQMGAASSWGHVREFMQATEFSTCTVVERQGIYNLLADLLLRYVRRVASRQGLPVTLKLIASCSAHVGSTFESEFPGYLASGLGKVIVRQMLAQKSS